MNRHDAIVELASDNVSSVQQLVYDGNFRMLEKWLQPLFIKQLKSDLAELNDADFAAYYHEQLGTEPTE